MKRVTSTANTEASVMAMELRVLRGARAGEALPLPPGQHTLGRSADCSFVLDDDKVSGHHARIDADGSQCLLRDLDSTNGTLLNGTLLSEPAVLRPGDVVQVGNTVLLCGDGELPPDQTATGIRLVLAEAMPQLTVARSSDKTTIILPPTAQGLEADDLRRLYAVLRALYRVTGLVSRSATLDELLKSVLATLFDLLPADRGAVIFVEGADSPLQLRAARCRSAGDDRVEVSETIVRDVVATGRGLLTQDATDDERLRSRESILRHGIRSALCVPIRTPRHLFGVLYLDTRSPLHQFAGADLELLAAVGAEVGLAVENLRLRQQNLEAERLAAAGQAIAGISHYIKNILQSIEAARVLIDAAIEDDDKPMLEEAWATLDQNTELISELVLNMLSLTRRPEPKPSICCPNAVAAELVELLAPRARERGTTLDLDLDPSMPEGVTDRGALHRALLNLLTNAIDATGEGRVVVSSRWDAEGGRAVFVVTDEGPGIPLEHVQDIFQAFFTTKGWKGTGLGLAVTKKLVEDLGGRIAVENEPGGGASFTIALPLRPSGEAAGGVPAAGHSADDAP